MHNRLKFMILGFVLEIGSIGAMLSEDENTVWSKSIFAVGFILVTVSTVLINNARSKRNEVVIDFTIEGNKQESEWCYVRYRY